MKLTIKGNPEEIKKVLQAIGSSEEHSNLQNQINVLAGQITKVATKLDFKATKVI